MSVCTGRQFPSVWQNRVSGFRFRLRRRLSTNLSVKVDNFDLSYVCQSPMEEMRVRSLLVKEEGTIDWLRQYVRPAEVFLDVGANIGIYTLLAAKIVGPRGRVYAVEPHAVNVLSLMQNIATNGLQDCVQVISSALHHSTCVEKFNYYSLEPGSSMSQLGETRDASEQEFIPVMTELKLAISIDDLVDQHGMAPPHHIKIDVDGNELRVVEGMMGLLRGKSRPRSVQVEVNQRYKEELFAKLDEAGYVQTLIHYTAGGKYSLASGVDPNEIPYNALFEPRCQADPIPKP